MAARAKRWAPRANGRRGRSRGRGRRGRGRSYGNYGAIVEDGQSNIMSGRGQGVIGGFRGRGRGRGGRPLQMSTVETKEEKVEEKVEEKGGPLPDAPECLLCTNPIEHFAVVPCSHSGDICGNCVTRMRRFLPEAQGSALKCPFCKSEWKRVILTREKGKTFEECLPVNKNLYIQKLRFYTDSPKVYQRFMKKSSIYCKPCDKNGIHTNFRNLHQLRRHLEQKHSLFLCHACVQARKQPIEEAELFTRSALMKHFKKGTPARGNDPAIKPHPFCPFCRDPYFSKDELFAHMESAHFQCAHCNRENPSKKMYFRTKEKRRQHYEAEHFLCKHPDCQKLGYDVVFFNNVDFTSHNLHYHTDQKNLSRSQRRKAATITLGGLAVAETKRRGNRHRNRDRDIATINLDDSDEEDGSYDEKMRRLEEAERRRESMRQELERRYKAATERRKASASPSNPPSTTRMQTTAPPPEKQATKPTFGKSQSVPNSIASIVGRATRTLNPGIGHENFPALRVNQGSSVINQNSVYRKPPISSKEAFPPLPVEKKKKKRKKRRKKKATVEKDRPPSPEVRPVAPIPVSSGSTIPAACPDDQLKERNLQFMENLRKRLGGDEGAFTAIRRAMVAFMKNEVPAVTFFEKYIEYCEDTSPLLTLVSLVRSRNLEKAKELYVLLSPGSEDAKGPWQGKHSIINNTKIDVLYNPSASERGEAKNVYKEAKRPQSEEVGIIQPSPKSALPAWGPPKAQEPPPEVGNMKGTYLAGESVWALYPPDGMWYPATILGSQGKDYIVRYLGYGNQISLAVKSIRASRKPLSSAAPSPVANIIPQQKSAPKIEKKEKPESKSEGNKSGIMHNWEQEGMIDPRSLSEQVYELVASKEAALQLLVLSEVHAQCDEYLYSKNVKTPQVMRMYVPGGKRAGLVQMAKRPKFSRKNPQLFLALSSLRSVGFKESSYQYVSQISTIAQSERSVGNRMRQWIHTCISTIDTTDICLLHQFSQMLILRAIGEAQSLCSVNGAQLIRNSHEAKASTQQASEEITKGGKKKKKKKKKILLF